MSVILWWNIVWGTIGSLIAIVLLALVLVQLYENWRGTR